MLPAGAYKYGGREGPRILLSTLPNKANSYYGLFRLWLFPITEISNYSHFDAYRIKRSLMRAHNINSAARLEYHVTYALQAIILVWRWPLSDLFSSSLFPFTNISNHRYFHLPIFLSSTDCWTNSHGYRVEHWNAGNWKYRWLKMSVKGNIDDEKKLDRALLVASPTL